MPRDNKKVNKRQRVKIRPLLRTTVKRTKKNLSSRSKRLARNEEKQKKKLKNNQKWRNQR